MVTHEPAAAANCQRVIVLRDGLVAGSFDTRTTDAATHGEGALDAGSLALRAQELARAAR
jgi:hypothetical protein